ncbi:Predicted exporter protein, RND superfamily [Haloarcula vallismortis]|uniref:Patched family protein n=2 Tax=Haloarcula vallismortis TaxID=28442 RepID=M0JGQ5_HALVA|nr:MMPL family transporter [Haloarcula vallismortis]EMA06870.1 patched family protein [Haloarcula vallismortis ATCC 29715]SDX39505.1 Predicted exporter protein, RND superfamily [Haloarcula vallismortis]
MNYQWIIDRIDTVIVARPKTVIVAFLLLTVLFASGLGSITTESGQEQFIEDLPSYQAVEDINDEFSPTFTEETTSTTIVQDSNNVLSRASLIDMLETRQRILDSDPLRAQSVSTPAETVATTLDPSATTPEEQLWAVESATQAEIDAAVREAADEPGFENQLSDDFNRESASASASRATVTHEAGPGAGASGGPGGGSEFPSNRVDRIQYITHDDASNIWVQGTAPDTTATTTGLVLPAALVLILVFLTVAYRDPVDIGIGLLAIIMTLIWTFGFIGIAGIPFAVLLIAIPPILIAIGIDFGIHSINRYREERVRGAEITEAMTRTTDQMTVAFAIVTGTSAVGFLSNMISAFPPTQDFGLVAAAGIIFTFFIFGVFVPAAKVAVDRARQRYPIPTMATTPLGSESSPLGRLLSVGVTVAKRGPLVFLLLTAMATAGGAVYATGVDTGFSPDDFQPAEETPEYMQSLPESIRPPEQFEYVRINNYLDRHFEENSQVLMYVEGPMTEDSALEEIHRASQSPPPTFERDRRQAETQSIITLIQSRAERDPEFRALVKRNDRNDNGIPDDNLPQIYAALAAPADSDLDSFLADDRRSAQVIYTVDGDADDKAVTNDAYTVANSYRMAAQPTGSVIIFDEAISLVLESVIETLILTLVGAAGFLIMSYWIIEGRPSLGVVNVIPILVTVVAVVASMRALGIAFNAINGTILAIAVGIGIDYAVHVVHRFADEYHERPLYPALQRTVIGTGGALTGSMLTTVFGIGVLVLALNPALGVFGILISLSVLYAYLSSVLLLPSIIVVWERLATESETPMPLFDAVSDAATNQQSPSAGD